MNDVLGNGLFVLLGAAISAVSAFYAQKRVAERQAARADHDALAAQKRAIITDLISYRFVITGGPIYDPAALSRFNAALSAIPAYFFESKPCMDLYRSLGENFTPTKFYLLTKALMEDVPLEVKMIDEHLLASVPSARYNPPNS